MTWQPFTTGLPYLTVDGAESVTLFRHTAGDGYDAGTTIAHAKRRVARKSKLESFGQVTTQELIWHLWAGEVGSPAPQAGDVVQDGTGARWSVMEDGVETLGTRYRLKTLKEKT